MPAALAELLEALAWEEFVSDSHRKRLEDAVTAAIERVQTFPAMGSPYLRRSRRIVLSDHPYSLVYMVRGRDIVIVAFAHTARRPGYWADRTR